MQLNRARTADGGFTLIELLIVIVIMGIITVPLADVIIGFSRNTDATTDRLALSHDAQISSAFFAGDVATIGVRDYTATPDASGNIPFKQSVQLNAAYDAGGQVCGTSTTPTAAIRFLSDDWNISGSNPAVGTDVVAYYLLPLSPTISELHRMRCAAGSTTPTDDVVVAHNVVASTLAVTCSSTCTSTTLPQAVTMTFTVSRPSTDDYTITLTGQRRQT